MKNANLSSGQEFLDILTSRWTVSTLLDAAERVNFDEISDVEQEKIAKKLYDLATEKNGARVIMGLPGPMQALLFFADITMPGLDRRAYLKGRPRQVLRHLIHNNDSQIIQEYPFHQLSKADWKFYLKQATDIIEPCRKFLTRSESDGGFSDQDISDILLSNMTIVDLVPVARILPECAVALLLKAKDSLLWKTYDFSRFLKKHWVELITRGNLQLLPKAFASFVANTSHEGFTADELVELVYYCDDVEMYIDPHQVDFNKVYSLYRNGKGRRLWAKYPFETLAKPGWELILANPAIEIPKSFKTAVARGIFTIDELLVYAYRNEKIVQFLPLERLSVTHAVDLLIVSKSPYLWKHYNLKLLSAADWVKLIVKRKEFIAKEYRLLLAKIAEWDQESVRAILGVDYRYYSVFPVDLIPHDLVIDYLAAGKCDEWWRSYPFEKFTAEDWFTLFECSSHAIPKAGIVFLLEIHEKADIEKVNNLLRRKRIGVVYVNADIVYPDVALVYLLGQSDCILWRRYDFRRFSREQLSLLIFGASDRDIWPESIVQRFDDEKTQLSDDEILKLAAIKPISAVALLSARRLNLCDLLLLETFFGSISPSSAAVSVARRRLSDLGDWQQLTQERQAILISKLPAIQDCINWQEWTLQDLHALFLRNRKLYNFLHANLKLKFFFWKYRHVIVVLSIVFLSTIALTIAYVLEKERMARIEREIQSRREQIICEFEQLDLDRNYEAIKDALSVVAMGEDAVILQGPRLLAVTENMEKWFETRKEVRETIEKLDALNACDWPKARWNEAENLIDQIKNKQMLVEEERELKRCQNRFAELKKNVLIQETNDDYLRRIEVLRTRLTSSASAEESFDSEMRKKYALLTALEVIEIDGDINSRVREACSSFKSAISQRVEKVCLRELDRIEKEMLLVSNAGTIKLLQDSVAKVRGGSQNNPVVIQRCDILSRQIDVKRDELEHQRLLGVADVLHQKVLHLRDRLPTLRLADPYRLWNDIVSLSYTDDFSFYLKQYPDEYERLKASYSQVLTACELFDKICKDLLVVHRELGLARVLTSEEKETVSLGIAAFDSWLEEYAVDVPWLQDDVTAQKRKLLEFQAACLDLESLIQCANSATDYITLFDTLNRLEQYKESDECAYINFEQMIEPKIVESLQVQSGWLSYQPQFDFLGLIKIDSSTTKLSLMINNEEIAEGVDELYCVEPGTKYYDHTENVWKRHSPTPKMIFKRGKTGRFQKIRGIDYSYCQGLGIFKLNK